MNLRTACMLIGALAGAGPAFAACGDNNSYLNVSQLNAILTGNYACGRSTTVDPPGWNERHLANGSLVEQHEGGATVETVGTWAVTNAQGRGRVTYSYSGGSAPVYEVARVSGDCTGQACTNLPQSYQFCGVGGGAPAVLNIYVSTTFQAPTGPPWVMNTNCPSN